MRYNLFQLFHKVYFNFPTHTLFKYKINDQWNSLNYQQLIKNVDYCSYLLQHRYNIKPDDRVMYQGSNSIEWISWNLACYRIGGIWVPSYPNQSIDYYRHLINDCQPKILIKEQNSLTDDNLDYLIPIINNKLSYEKDNLEIDKIQIDRIKEYQTDISNLIYTSGTTGKPKGVMLTHTNIISNLNSIQYRFKEMDNGLTSLNILPWSHIYGMTCELYYNLLNKNTIAISSSKEHFINECKEINPEVLYVVPRILELIKTKLDKFNFYPLDTYLIPLLLKKIVGNNLKIIFVGGSYLNKDTLSFYENYGIKICQGYGCSETSPLISINHYLDTERNIESIGKILDNVKVKICKETEEILVSGDNVMNGYWNNIEETNKVLVKDNNNNIWYKTGDEGELRYNYLFYKGRIKENYKLSNGKFVNVNEIETIIKTVLPHLQNICVFSRGDFTTNELITDTFINKKQLNLINQYLDKYLMIKNIIYTDTELFNHFLTPKMSLKRKEFIYYLTKNKII